MIRAKINNEALLTMFCTIKFPLTKYHLHYFYNKPSQTASQHESKKIEAQQITSVTQSD